MALIKQVFGVLCIVAIATALPAEESARSSNDIMDSIYSDCLNKDSVSCVKYKLFSFVDKMVGQKDTFALTEGVTVIKTPGTESEGAPRSISGDESIESLILSRVSRFLNTHTIKVDLNGADIVSAVASTGRALEDASGSFFGAEDSSVIGDESRGKKKKVKKLLGPLMMLVALKAAALIPLLLGGIALLAGKALLISKLALVLSAIIGLKKLLSKEKHVSYEVVSHPHHTSSHSSSHGEEYGSAGLGDGGSAHGGWGRSAQEVAYSAQKPY